MSRNKKVLSKATRELNKTRRVPVPKNIIEDPRGQWAHPGEITRIPSDTITMQGVPYPVMAYPNVGQPQMMYPGQEYYFPGADHVDEYPQMQDGGIISQEEIDAANRAMMKARLAYAQMHGNPAAQRMVVAPDQPYEYTGDEYDQLWGQPVGVQPGMIGTHYMASFGNYAVPFIQQGSNGLYFNEAPSVRDREAIRFDNEDDAQYFGEHYKEITPDESYRQEEDDYIETELTPEEIEEYQKGGWIVEEIDSKGVEGCPEGHYWTGTECREVPKNTKVVYSQEELDKLNRIKKEESKLYNEYRARQKYYTTNQPSGSASVLSRFYKDIKSLPKGPGADPIISYGPMDPYADQRYGRESGVGLDEWQKILKKSSVKPIGYKQGWNFAEYYPVYARPKSLNYVLGVEEEPEPVREKEEPIPTLKPTRINQELQKFIYPEDYPDPEITSDTDADIENYVENGPDSAGAEWNDSLKRYIDWDGNRIPYRLPRFRKSGHYGDLIKPGKRRYIPIPSIESRYQAEIEIAPEEYAKGGDVCPEGYMKDEYGACIRIQDIPGITVTNTYDVNGRKWKINNGVWTQLSNDAEVINAHTRDRQSAYKKGKSERAFRNITPQGYGDILKNLERYKRLKNNLGRDKNELRWDTSPTGKQMYYSIPRRDDMFSLYLGLPQQNNSFVPQLMYRPTNEKDPSSLYYKPNYWTEKGKQALLNQYLQMSKNNYNKNIYNERDAVLKPIVDSLKKAGVPDWDPQYGTVFDNPLGDFTVTKGKDEYGNYISIYDKIDFNPFQTGAGASINPAGAALQAYMQLQGYNVNADTEASSLFGAGKPYEIYDRIYYDPKTKKVIKQNNYAKGGQYQMGGYIVEEIDDVDSPAAPCPSGQIYDPITKGCVPENAYRLQRAVVKDAINVDDAIRENRRYYKGYKFMQDWMNSPMYDKMLKESARSPESYEWLKKMRQQQLQSTPPLQILPQPKDQPNTGGYSWSDTGQIVILPEGFGTRGTHSHEVSHSSDRPVKGKTSRLIPQKDIDYINKNKAKSFKNSREYYNDKKQYDKDFKDYPEYADAVDKNFKDFSTDYVGDPTETRARLNAIRQIAKEAGIYDPFTEGVSPGLYYDKLKRYQFEKGSKAGFDPMKQLQDVYSDEEIIWLLNHMSKTEDNKPELDMAQRGGQYNIGDEVELTEAEVKRLKKLGYIIERV